MQTVLEKMTLNGGGGGGEGDGACGETDRTVRGVASYYKH